MPMAKTVETINTSLTRESIALLKREAPGVIDLLGEPGALVEVADKVLGLNVSEREYISAIPATLREAMRAAMYEAIIDGRGVHVSYSPAFDFDVKFWDYGDSLIVHLAGPFRAPFARDQYQIPEY